MKPLPHVVHYPKQRMPFHPLASKHGIVPVHRYIVYEAVGPGPQKCHWCGKSVHWKPKPGEARLVVDHLNGVTTDNYIDNLVVACIPCNGHRMRHGRIDDGELYVVDCRGRRSRATYVNCAECGKRFLSRVNTRRIPYHRFCSGKCACRQGLGKVWHLNTTYNKILDGELFVERPGIKHGKPAQLRNRAEPATCQVCGKEFLRVISAVKRGRGKYCSKACRNVVAVRRMHEVVLGVR